MRTIPRQRRPAAYEGGNLVLIGMPGAGKSTIGVLLAKALSMGFTDTDVLIQSLECRRLQDIIASEGLDAFLHIEEAALLTLERTGHVIATGGSAVYSEAAMRKLAAEGVIAHLDLPLPALEARLADLDERGVVRAPGQTLDALYAERQPLYERYRDFAVDCSGKGHQETVNAVISQFEAQKRGAPDLNGD